MIDVLASEVVRQAVTHIIAMQPGRTIIFPERAVVQLCRVGRSGDWEPYRVAGAIASVRVFARHKNDYDLGPFVSDAEGRITMSGDALRAYAAATVDSGIMDHARVDEAFPFVEIRLWTGRQVSAAIEARQTWGLLPAEGELWSSAEAMLGALRSAPNARFQTVPNAGYGIVRDLWDSVGASREYRILVSDPAAA